MHEFSSLNGDISDYSYFNATNCYSTGYISLTGTTVHYYSYYPYYPYYSYYSYYQITAVDSRLIETGTALKVYILSVYSYY